jgi:SAM-dependent methyltransferase
MRPQGSLRELDIVSLATQPDSAMQFFDNAYEGTPTWDIGRPQGAVVRLATAGSITGPILDVGCGTGENALYLAALGHPVVGVDLARAAIEKAKAKAAGAGGATVEFLVWDAMRLGDLDRSFQTAVDSGLFHCLAPGQRAVYATSLREAVVPGGCAYLLCWSARNRLGIGPERIYKSDIRTAFRSGWSVEAIEEESLETLLPMRTVHAWLARLRRI